MAQIYPISTGGINTSNDSAVKLAKELKNPAEAQWILDHLNYKK